MNENDAERLFEILKQQINIGNEEEEKKPYRYVIYSRKSEDDKKKQVRSLSDQIKECKEIAEKRNLKIVQIIQEAESAKEPGIRPEFRKMLEDISSGKIDGIIAWHPDRLARNMKDAGEVIDLLDKHIIKDLQFCTFSFENNAAGKMVLGMAFVISKQYTDQLSSNVKRANKRSLEEGKYINRTKFGYYKDRNQYLRPDGNNFVLIKQAFLMRLENKTLEEIAKFLNNNGFTLMNKDGNHYSYKMDKKRVSEFLRNPFYTGICIYGENMVNYCEIFDFVPAVSVDNYLKINKFSTITKAYKLAYSVKKDFEADLMRGMVICGKCGEKTTAGITKKKNKKGKTLYYYFRCDTPDCKMHGKSVRAKILQKFIYNFLENNQFDTDKLYKKYLVLLDDEQKRKNQEMQKMQRQLNLKINIAEKNKKEIKKLLLDANNQPVRDEFSKDLVNINKEIKKHQTQIAQIRGLLNKNVSVAIAYKEFLELFNKIAKISKKVKTMRELDSLARILFLNFTIKDGKVADFSLNSPFKELLQEAKVLECGHGWT